MDQHRVQYVTTGIVIGSPKAFRRLRALLPRDGSGPFCFGATPGLADVCLVPQMANARRLKCPLDPYPQLQRAEAAALALPAFRDTAPDRQPDAA